jgi:hypothetical protein
MRRIKKFGLSLFISFFVITGLPAQELFSFGQERQWDDVVRNNKKKPQPVKWFQVSTNADTWKVGKEVLICTGLPIGVVRSEHEYENFIIHIEWRHMAEGGNSGTFIWSKANARANGLPDDGLEVQMLDPGYLELAAKKGNILPDSYISGELFGIGSLKVENDNPSLNGTRSRSTELRCKGKGEWNTYDVVCVDGTVKLAINGKFVNGVSKATQRKGYICLESEGSEIQFRNIQIIRLP